MGAYIGVDLGGTHIGAAVVDSATGELSALRSIYTRSREGPEAVVARMVTLIEEVIAESGQAKTAISGIGIGVPGRLDMQAGVVHYLPNLHGHWQGVPLLEEIVAALEMPTTLINDVRAMTLAEWTFGAGQGVDSIACLAVGTGVGGGFVIDGKLHLGLGGVAGEIGHQVVEPDGPACGCGGRGCLETLASGPAITAMGLEAVTRGLATRIGELAGYDLNSISPGLIAEAARGGDAVAKAIYDKAGFYLGIAVANVLTALAPRRVVIGGGVAQVGDLLLEPIRRTVRERVFIVPAEQVEIVPARLGVNAGLIGAALWAGHSRGR
ncbi:MAG: ROK family protein [Anaerolineales bacterium]|nr:ROK family protein [Anaerolineales bacterium]